jgi:hypothetical protein
LEVIGEDNSIPSPQNYKDDGQIELHKLLTAFYRKHGGLERGETVDSVMMKYAGHTTGLVTKLYAQYKKEMSQVEELQFDNYLETYGSGGRNGVVSLRLSPRLSQMRTYFPESGENVIQSNTNKQDSPKRSPPKVPELKLGRLSSGSNSNSSALKGGGKQNGSESRTSKGKSVGKEPSVKKQEGGCGCVIS